MSNEKEFFDKVADVATDVADTIVKTTSDLYQKGKVQVELAKLQSDVRELNKKLGAVCYSLEKGYSQDDGRKAELIEQLDDLNDRIHEIESTRENEKYEREAERAAAKEAKDAEKAARDVKNAQTDEACTECGENRVGKMPYCGFCGAKFE